jgi:hypothetical protein
VAFVFAFSVAPLLALARSCFALFPHARRGSSSSETKVQGRQSDLALLVVLGRPCSFVLSLRSPGLIVERQPANLAHPRESLSFVFS